MEKSGRTDLADLAEIPVIKYVHILFPRLFLQCLLQLSHLNISAKKEAIKFGDLFREKVTIIYLVRTFSTQLHSDFFFLF
jgi:hypothetical protein